MKWHRYSASRGPASIGRRLATIGWLLMFVLAAIVHVPGHNVAEGPLLEVSAAAMDRDADGGTLVVDHCHCMVTAPWPAAVLHGARSKPHDVPMVAAHVLATLHLENDGPPPKA